MHSTILKLEKPVFSLVFLHSCFLEPQIPQYLYTTKLIKSQVQKRFGI